MSKATFIAGRRALTALSVLVSILPLAAFGQSVEEHVFDSDGVEIRYLMKGEGEPLVLIHGFTASVEANWMMPGVLDKLAEGFQVIAFDARGHGKSGKPRDPAQYGDKMVRDVINLLDHLGIEQAHVGGYSMGGFITMQLVAHHPERLLSAIVGAAGWRPEGQTDPMMEELAASLDAGEGIEPLIRALHPADAPPLAEEQIAMMNQMVVGANDQKALAAVIRGMGEMTVTEAQLRGNEVRTLAIIGSRDPLVESVKPMVGVMSNLEVRYIDGADHMTALMNPQYATQLADGFFDFLVAFCKCA